MRKLKKPLSFAFALMPVALFAGYFVSMYQFELYDQETVAEIISQVGSKSSVVIIAAIQTMVLAGVLGFIGYVLSDKIGLMKPFRLEKHPLARTLILSLIFGIIFSLDYWTFGKWIPGNEIQDAAMKGLTPYGWGAAILYGGVIEEIMLRLFAMSLIALILWKVFYRKNETVPVGILMASNVIAAILFAAGHLPATAVLFGELTPIVILRCFLLNGAFGLLFGWLYRKYGIQYAMASHALLHIISKTIWTVFT